MYIKLLQPYVNFIDFKDGRRKLYWCNKTFVEAIDYYKFTFYIDIDFMDIVNSLDAGLLPEMVTALVYGALKVSYPNLTYQEFNALEFNSEEVVFQVLDGVTNYLPPAAENPKKQYEAEKQVNESLEDSNLDWSLIYRALKAEHFSVQEIMQMTLRGTFLYFNIYPEDGAQDTTSDIEWLISM